MPSIDAPPSYEDAAKTKRTSTGAAASSSAADTSGASASAIPSDVRRSMEDAQRPLPKGWIRQWDPNSQHNFFVDTQAKPPRSIWMHPLDDEEYQRSNPEEARRLEQQAREGGGASSSAPGYDARSSSAMDPQTQAAVDDESTADESDVTGARAGDKSKPTGLKKLGRNVKDRLTSSTHDQRVAKREKKREEERRAYQMHQEIRNRMMQAVRTGQPQLVGRDRNGRDIYAQPPPPGFYGRGATLGYTPYQTYDQYAYGPGSYAAPMSPYGRRPGYGYGGGMGLPIVGGLAGGALLGGLLF